MTTAQLLALAGVLAKDPSNDVYTATIVYSMFTAAQEAIATSLHHSYLRQLKSKEARASIATPGTYDLETDFLRPCYIERDSDGVEVEFLELESKGLLQNANEGGTDRRPRWIMYNDSGTMKAQILVDTYPFTGTEYYIKRPPTIGASQEPVIIGFDNLMIIYFKHLFHLAEGQAELAAIALKEFDDMVNNYNTNRRS